MDPYRATVSAIDLRGGGASVPSYYLTCGEFIADSQAAAHDKGIGMRIEFIDFIPDPDGMVALIQAVKCTSGASLNGLAHDYPSGGGGVRDENIWTADHWAIDAPGVNRVCPAFGMEFPSDADNAWERWNGARDGGGAGRLGRVNKSPNALTFTAAMLDDQPSRKRRAEGTAFHHQFESVAMRICKRPSGLIGEVRGVIVWGYKVTEAKAPVLTIDVPVVTRRPSATWLEAATQWNSAKGMRSRIPGDSTAWAL